MGIILVYAKISNIFFFFFFFWGGGEGMLEIPEIVLVTGQTGYRADARAKPILLNEEKFHFKLYFVENSDNI